MSARRFAPCFLAALVPLAGCTLARWNDLESQSPIKTVRSTSPFPDSTFGILLSSYRMSLGGHEFSRLVVGTGLIAHDATTAEGIFGAYSFWEDDHLELGTKLYTQCSGITANCPDDAGTTLSPVADMLGRQGCVLAGAPAAPTPQVLLACETSDSASGPALTSLMSPAAPTARFGASLAPIPAEARDLGLAFASAPGANEIYRLDDTGAFTLLPFQGFTPAPPSGFGTAVATAPIAPVDPMVGMKLPPSLAHTLLAVTSPDENRVYLFFARVTPSMNEEAVLLGCVDGPRVDPLVVDGFGTALVAGDLTGDGMPEIVIGSTLSAPNRLDEVRIVSLADIDPSMGLAPGCGDPATTDDPPTRVLGCPADPNLQVSCDGFGAAIAIGNADGSPSRDLLVGAPLATVGDVSHAGAAFLFAGADSLDVVVSAANEPVRLVDSSPTVNDTLGLAVTFVGSQLTSTTPREEVVVSVPGSSRLFAYLCSGIAGDSIDDEPSTCVRGD